MVHELIALSPGEGDAGQGCGVDPYRWQLYLGILLGADVVREDVA